MDLFIDTPIQVAVHQLYFCETRNISFDNDTTQLEFSIPGNCTEYLNLQEWNQLQKADSSALGAYENINSLLVQSVFSQIGVYFIRKMMSQNTRSPRQVYFKVLLSSGEDCSNVQMQIQLNFLDQESVNDRTPKPEGLRKRVLTVNENVQTWGS